MENSNNPQNPEFLKHPLHDYIFTKDKKMQIELWVLVDKTGQRIYYTGYSEETVKNYKESNCFNETIIVKLTGELPKGELNV